MMLERQREGVIKAKAAGKYKGRKPTPNAIRQEVIRLAGERMTKTAIAGQLNIGEATVYRILAGASKQTLTHKRVDEWLRVHVGKQRSAGMRLSLFVTC